MGDSCRQPRRTAAAEAQRDRSVATAAECSVLILGRGPLPGAYERLALDLLGHREPAPVVRYDAPVSAALKKKKFIN